MKRSFKNLQSVIGSFLDIIFKEECLSCHKSGSVLCDTCTRTLPHSVCTGNDAIKACFDYHNPSIKKAVWNLKYKSRSSIGDTMGRLVYETLMEDISDMKYLSQGSPIIVIPVPLARKRLKIRGYNQAEKIARGFMKYAQENIFSYATDVVERRKDTLPQARILDKTKRLLNMKKAFTLSNSEKVRGKMVIVIDDVTTTGATLLEIITLLEKAGAMRAVGFAFAH